MSPRPTVRAGTLIPLSWWHDAAIMSLSPAGRDLLVRLLSWSADEQTDGKIPTAIANMFAAGDPSGTALAELVKARQITEQPGSFLVTEWAIYNLSSDGIEVRRELRVEAGRRGGQVTAAKNQVVRGEGGRFLGTTPTTEASTEAPASVGASANTEASTEAPRNPVSPSHRLPSSVSPSHRLPSIPPAPLSTAVDSSQVGYTPPREDPLDEDGQPKGSLQPIPTALEAWTSKHEAYRRGGRAP